MASPQNSANVPRFVALQHRDFRLLWYGQLISVVGTQMQLIAVNWHIYDLLRGNSLTLSLLGHSLRVDAQALGLGTLGLVRVVPIVVFALIGGMLADTRDRRRVMILTQTAMALCAALLAFLTFLGLASLATIYILTGATAAAAVFDNPARQSLVPNLVPREHLTNAVSLNTLLLQIGTIAGPAIAGLLIGRFNPGVVYALNGLSFVAVIVALLMMHSREHAPATNTGVGWAPLVEGLHYVYRSRIIWGTMMVDFLATFFASAMTMLPLVAGNILHVGAAGYGVLSTGQSVGAVIAGVIMSVRKDVYRQGAVLLISVVIYGAATALFGLSTVFMLSYALLALTGAADTVSTVIRGTVGQIMTPDHLRGRMTSVTMIFFTGGPQLGELEAGLVASLLGVVVSIVSGGIATVLLTGLIAWKYPRLRSYTSKTAAEHAAGVSAGVKVES